MTLTLEKRIQRRNQVVEVYEELGVNATGKSVRDLLAERGVVIKSRGIAQDIINDYRNNTENGVVFLNVLPDDKALELFSKVIPVGMHGFNRDSLFRVMNEHRMFVSGGRLVWLWTKYKKNRKLAGKPLGEEVIMLFGDGDKKVGTLIRSRRQRDGSIIYTLLNRKSDIGDSQ